MFIKKNVFQLVAVCWLCRYHSLTQICSNFDRMEICVTLVSILHAILFRQISSKFLILCSIFVLVLFLSSKRTFFLDVLIFPSSFKTKETQIWSCTFLYVYFSRAFWITIQAGLQYCNYIHFFRTINFLKLALFRNVLTKLTFF